MAQHVGASQSGPVKIISQFPGEIQTEEAQVDGTCLAEYQQRSNHPHMVCPWVL